MRSNLLYDTLILALVLGLLLLVKYPFLNVFLPFIIIIFYSYKNNGFYSSLGFSKPKSIQKLIALAFGLAVLLNLFSYAVLLPQIEKSTRTSLQIGVFVQVKNNPTFLFTSLLIGWVVGGLFEETIFRGFIISKFIAHIHPKLGAVIGTLCSSFLFGYLHSYQGITGQILLIINGLFLAIIYLYSNRNLWLNVLTHGFINTISMLVLYFDLIKLS